MKMALLASASAASLALIMSATAAEAQSEAGQKWYVSIFGGALFTEEENFNYFFNANPYDGNLTFDTGFIVGGAVGVDGVFFDNVRAEIEFAFSSHDPDTWTGVPVGGGGPYIYSVNGEIETYTILANVWYDFEVGLPITPYIGGGAGVAFVRNNLRLVGFENYTGTSTEFAFQAGAGVKYALDTNVWIDLSYRFRGVLDVDPRPDGITASNNLSDFDLFTHSVQAGITIAWPPN